MITATSNKDVLLYLTLKKALTHSLSSLHRHLVAPTTVPAPPTRALLSAFYSPSLLAYLEPGVKALTPSSIPTIMACTFPQCHHSGHVSLVPSSISIPSAALKAAP